MKRSVILIVDDDNDDFELLREAIMKSGFEGEIIRAVDAIQALTILETEALPTLVVLDLVLPKMNGIQLMSRLVGFGIPIIVHTLYCSDDILNNLLSMGALDCVKKASSYTETLDFARRLVRLAEGAELER